MILAVVYAFTKDGTPMGRHPIFGAVFHWFGAMCTVLLWLTALSNPGIVVRGGPGTVDPEAVDADDIYCDICDIWVGPRTHHCRDCGVCIEKHDHHCVWMGKCIGKGECGEGKGTAAGLGRRLQDCSACLSRVFFFFFLHLVFSCSLVLVFSCR
mmetsp:Transcript_10410/g.31212  ORF Transcript_10410/g.31212 Transcript_10410/m.31212 type:complete len:154 (-) Transcript_10410:264-725(-)